MLNDLRLMKDALGVTTIILANRLVALPAPAALEESKLEEIAFHTQVLQEAAGYVEQLIKPSLSSSRSTAARSNYRKLTAQRPKSPPCNPRP